MSEMIERAAQMLLRRLSDINPANPNYWRLAVKSVIEVMREPTLEMVNAAWIDDEHSPNGVLVREYSVSHHPEDLKNDTAYQVWQAMIDEALK